MAQIYGQLVKAQFEQGSADLSSVESLVYYNTTAHTVKWYNGTSWLTAATTSLKLSSFAATSSSELAGIISDETGSGLLVFGTAPTIVGGSITALTAFALRDTSAAFDVTIAAASTSTLTAGRTLTYDGGDSARTIKLRGSIDLANSFTTSGNNALTLTTSGGATNVTLPTTGTLATLAGSESLTNKTLNSTTNTINSNLISPVTSGKAVRLIGVTDGTAPTAGDVGEEMIKVLSRTNRKSLTDATSINVTASTDTGTDNRLDLTAGNWEVSGVVGVLTAATTTIITADVALSLTSATLPSSTLIANPTVNESRLITSYPASYVPAGDAVWVIPNFKVSVTGSTPMYLVANIDIGISTAQVYGYMRARRVV